MKQLLLLALLAYLNAPELGVSDPSAEAGNISATQLPGAIGVLTAAQMRADFDLMRQSLEEAHPGLYRYSTKREMDLAFEAQRAKLNRPSPKIHFLLVVSELLAAIRCGHTHCQPDDETQHAMESVRFFPLRVMVEDGRLAVVSNDTPDDQTIRPGMQLLTINGSKVEDVLRKMWPLEDGDGDIETGRRMHIEKTFTIYYWALMDQSADFRVEARDGAGKMVTA